MKVNNEMRATIVERYQAGAFPKDLIEEFGISRDTVRTILHAAGVKPDRRRAGAASWTARNGMPPDEGDLQTGFRWCKRCGERKSISEFYWNTGRRTSRKRECKPCHMATSKASTDLRANRRKHAYGMTKDQWRQLLEAQGHACAVCREPATDDDGGGLRVDHDHSTGAVRGLLCDFCNRGLGMFRDNVDYLHAAAWYLETGWTPDNRLEFPVRREDQLGNAYLATKSILPDHPDRERVREYLSAVRANFLWETE